MIEIRNKAGKVLKTVDAISLQKANLGEANLGGADLWGADLQGAVLREADLRGANLQEANLQGAVLRDVDLREADLGGADLREANLGGANLGGIKTNYLTVGIHPAPEGDLIGWGKKDGKIVKLLIPSEARRSCATTRKFRAEFALCLEVEGAEIAIVENRWGITEYKPGHWVRPHEWDEDRWNECSGGIHFFLSREEAEDW